MVASWPKGRPLRRWRPLPCWRPTWEAPERGRWPVLKVDGLRAGYGALEVLHDISFVVESGEAVAILGANGTGKTTLMRALTGLIRTRAGTIMLDGQRIERRAPEQRVRDGLALVPEGRELFGSLTVRE